MLALLLLLQPLVSQAAALEDSDGVGRTTERIIDEVDLEQGITIFDEAVLAEGYIFYGVSEPQMQTAQTAIIRERARIPNTLYNFSSIHPEFYTLIGIPILEASLDGGLTWVTAFCVEVGVIHPNGETLTSGLPLTATQRLTIERILMYGYGNFFGLTPLEQRSSAAYITTQVAIWEVVAPNAGGHQRWTWESPWNGSGSGQIWNTLVNGNVTRTNMYNQIRSDIVNHESRPSFMSQTAEAAIANTQTLTWKAAYNRYQITLNDSNGVLARYLASTALQSSGAYSFQRDGNTLTIWTTDTNAPAYLFSPATFNKSGSGAQSTLFWVHPTLQNVVTGSVGDPVSAFLRVDVRSRGTMEIRKRSATTGAPLPETEFRITGNGVDQRVRTEANGNAVLYLEAGVYTVTETFVPAPYILDPTPREVTINWGEQTEVIFNNERAKGRLQLKKYGNQIVDTRVFDQGVDFVIQEVVLGNVTFSIYACEDIMLNDEIIYQGGDLVGTYTTDANGFIQSSKLHLGKYCVREISAPAGIYIPDVTYSFTLTYENQDVAIVIEELEVGNHLQDVVISLTKVGEDLENSDNYVPLEGVKFGLFANQDFTFRDGGLTAGTLIATARTDGEGKASFARYLPVGKFYIEELATLENFVLNEGRFEFEFTGENQDQKTVDIQINEGQPIVNYLTHTQILKVDESGQPLAGATLQVVNYAGEVIAEWISTTEPHQILGLYHGVYTLQEVAAPAGFALAEAIEFEVTDHPETIFLTMVNLRIRDTNLPVTGQSRMNDFVAVGAALIGLGVFAVKRKKQKKNDDLN